MSSNYAHQHANGFTSEGNVTEDNLYDRFDVRRKGTIASGQGVLARGTALGKITASGKWVKSLSASSDGSQVIRAILLHDVDATSADVEAVMGRRGRCNANAVTLGTGHTLASIDDACIDRGIILETVVGA
jgi:hypothetical protein